MAEFAVTLTVGFGPCTVRCANVSPVFVTVVDFVATRIAADHHCSRWWRRCRGGCGGRRCGRWIINERILRFCDWNVKKSKCLEQKYFGRAPACFHSDIKAVHIGNKFIKTLYSLMHLPVTILLNYLFISITNICFKKVVPNVNSYMYSSFIVKTSRCPT